MEIPFKERFLFTTSNNKKNEQTEGNKKELWIRSFILILMILPIMLLSHNMAVVVDYGIKVTNSPPLLSGVLIAIIVFTPESMTAVKLH